MVVVSEKKKSLAQKSLDIHNYRRELQPPTRFSLKPLTFKIQPTREKNRNLKIIRSNGFDDFFSFQNTCVSLCEKKNWKWPVERVSTRDLFVWVS